MTNSKIFGILNITNDSFSDGGLYLTPTNAIKKLEYFLSHNVYAVDIGAVSTRPNAAIVSEDDEIERLKIFLPHFSKYFAKQNETNKTKFSLDSYNFNAVKLATKHNLNIINDISGLKDERFIDLLVDDRNLEIVFMHSLSIPASKDIIMKQSGSAIITELANFAAIKIATMLDRGVSLNNITFDPGVGFGKNATQSLYIIQNTDSLKTNIKSILGLNNNIDIKILAGHSRKSFLREISGFIPSNNNQQDNITLDALTKFVSNTMLKSCDFIRIHEI